MIKTCPICKKEFEAYGRKTYCSPECLKTHRKEYLRNYAIENSEKLRQYKNHYNNSERGRKTRRAYYLKNREKILKNKRLYRQETENYMSIQKCKRLHDNCFNCDRPVGECRYD